MFLAYTIYTRYGGPEKSEEVDRFLSLLSETSAQHARVLGLAQRLAYQVSGATSAVLKRSALKLGKKGKLTLNLPSEDLTPGGDAVERRLRALGEALGSEDIAIEV